MSQSLCIGRRVFRDIAALTLTCAALSDAPALHAAEADALAISRNIQQRHLPYGTVFDPVFASSDPGSPAFTEVVSYTRAGDSAIWTGHYLAAEAFRYYVTRSPDALDSAWRALRGIRSLLDITGTGVLARCVVPVDSPYAAAILQEEGGHGVYEGTLDGTPYFWIGNTSRDQYSGVMFGLSLAYDLIALPDVRAFIQRDVTRILDDLLQQRWSVVMPDGRFSTSFALRPDQQLSFLQIGRRINPARFGPVYTAYRSALAGGVMLPIAYDNVDDHNSYFKFNLNYINLFSLIRLEESGSPFRRVYLNAYGALRGRTRDHGNAHFNMIDRMVTQADAARDGETVLLLDAWLQRPRRDYFVDRRGTYPECAVNRACDPVPVQDRANTDFLWQRSPFQLSGGRDGLIETAAIDYILPYWMARLYGIQASGQPQ
jgi:hypothetical protein